MGGKSDGGSQAQVQKTEPWEGVQGNLRDLYNNAAQQFHGTSTTAGSNWDLNQSMAMMKERALQGNPLQRESQNNVRSVLLNEWQDTPWSRGQMALQNGTAQGNFLSQGNPYLQGMVNAATHDVSDNFMKSIAPALASQFSAAGRTGSGAHAEAFGQAATGLAGKLGDITSNIRGNAYNLERGFMEQAGSEERARQYDSFNTERARKMQASQMAPGLLQMDTVDADLLQNVGLMQRDLQQGMLDDPMKRAQAYSSLLQGASGWGSTTSDQSARRPYNKVTGMLGGAMTGGMLGGMFAGAEAGSTLGPMGALVGAGLGLFG